MAECLLFLSYLEEERNEDDEEEEDDECATTEVRFVPADKGACKLSHIMRKPVYTIYNNKGADQPAHLRSLISAFVVRCLDSIIPLLAKSKISRL